MPFCICAESMCLRAAISMCNFFSEEKKPSFLGEKSAVDFYLT